MLKGLKQKVKRLLKHNTIGFVLGYVFCLYDTRILTGITLSEYMILKAYAIKLDKAIR